MFFDYSVTWSALVCTQYKNLPRWLNNKKLLAHITKRDRLQGKFDLVAQMRSSKAEFLSSPLQIFLWISGSMWYPTLLLFPAAEFQLSCVSKIGANIIDNIDLPRELGSFQSWGSFCIDSDCVTCLSSNRGFLNIGTIDVLCCGDSPVRRRMFNNILGPNL